MHLARQAASACLLAALVTGCVTDIHPQEDSIQPSTGRFGQYQNVVMKPLVYDEEAGVGRAAQYIRKQLTACMERVFKNLRPFDADALAGTSSVLIIEPSIVDLRKVPSAERVFFGPLAGSSAGLLKVQFTDGDKNALLAEPVFYAEANAWFGTWTVGILDNRMPTKLPQEACAYASQNF